MILTFSDSGVFLFWRILTFSVFFENSDIFRFWHFPVFENSDIFQISRNLTFSDSDVWRFSDIFGFWHVDVFRAERPLSGSLKYQRGELAAAAGFVLYVLYFRSFEFQKNISALCFPGLLFQLKWKRRGLGSKHLQLQLSCESCENSSANAARPDSLIQMSSS